MEAKDTVMKAGDLCRKVCQDYRSATLEAKDCAGLDCEKCQLEAQAEISFKAGGKVERERLMKEGLFTEKQWVFKISNGLKANATRTLKMLLNHIADKEKQAGIKEVVEWIREHNTSAHNKIVFVSMVEWEGKLKEWGIE